MDTQWRHKSKISERLGRCGRQNMVRPYLKIWDWDWILSRAVKAISSLSVRSPCFKLSWKKMNEKMILTCLQFCSTKSFQWAVLIKWTSAQQAYWLSGIGWKSRLNPYLVNQWLRFNPQAEGSIIRTRTTDAQTENSLHCTAKNSLPLPNF